MANLFVDSSAGNDTNNGQSGTPWLTISHGISNMSGSDTLWVKDNGVAYSISIALLPPSGTMAAPTQVFGYSSATGDTGTPQIKTTTGVFAFGLTGVPYINLRNLVLNGNGIGLRGVNIQTGGGNHSFVNVLAENFTGIGFSTTLASRFINCHAKSNAGVGFSVASTTDLVDCLAELNTGAGFVISSARVLLGCVSRGNLGAAGHGYQMGSAGLLMQGCIAYGNAGDGVNITAGSSDIPVILNSIFVNNSGAGINDTNVVGGMLTNMVDYNAFLNNGSGNRINFLPGQNDVALTVDPFTNASINDFSLNSASGGGLGLRAAGFPGATGWGSTGHVDIGAFQHLDSGSGTGGTTLINSSRYRTLGV